MVDPFDMEDVVIDKLKLPVLRRLLLIKFCLSKALGFNKLWSLFLILSIEGFEFSLKFFLAFS